MKLLTNENFPGPSLRYLRSRGFDIVSVQEKFPGIPDEQVIRLAKAENLVILTMDKDYGEIVFRKKVPDPPDIILFRFPEGTPSNLAGKAFESFMKEGKNISGSITVIEKSRVRQHAYGYA